MHSPIAATGLLEPIPRSPIHPKAAARFPAAFRALFRFPTRTVQKPQEVVILVTIMACLMVETDDRQWTRHIQTGYLEDKNVAIEYRWAESENNRLPIR